MKNALIISAIIGILLVSGSVFYYLVIFLPNKPSTVQELFSVQQAQKQTNSITEFINGVFSKPTNERAPAQARNTQRWSNINTILNAIGQNSADNKGVFKCDVGTVPLSAMKMSSVGGYNIAHCIVPTYISILPYDPTAAGAHFNSIMDYDSGYYIQRNPVDGRVTVTAPSAELGDTISVTR